MTLEKLGTELRAGDKIKVYCNHRQLEGYEILTLLAADCDGDFVAIHTAERGKLKLLADETYMLA